MDLSRLTRQTLADNVALAKIRSKAKADASPKFQPKGKATGSRYLLSCATVYPVQFPLSAALQSACFDSANLCPDGLGVCVCEMSGFACLKVIFLFCLVNVTAER